MQGEEKRGGGTVEKEHAPYGIEHERDVNVVVIVSTIPINFYTTSLFYKRFNLYSILSYNGEGMNMRLISVQCRCIRTGIGPALLKLIQ